MHHVVPLSPVDSLDCAYFLSPQGSTPQTRVLHLWRTRVGRLLLSQRYRPLFPNSFIFTSIQIPRGCGGIRTEIMHRLSTYTPGVRYTVAFISLTLQISASLAGPPAS